MTVYVDDMKARYLRMVMCHMVADTDEELHAMADIIGVSRKWWQGPPRHRSHYDICLSKKELAITAGAIEVPKRTLGMMTMFRRKSKDNRLPTPAEAEKWYEALRAQK